MSFTVELYTAKIFFDIHAIFCGHYILCKYLSYVQILLKLTVAQDVYIIADKRLLVAGLLIAFSSCITGTKRHLYSL